MRIDVFTIFPALVDGALGEALIGKARAGGTINLALHDPRDWTSDRHRSVDDAPFGGGPGMIMTPEPFFAAVEAVDPVRPLFMLSASGRRFDQALAQELADGPGFSMICGRYEGVDQRVADNLCDEELSIGDFVLAGGEAAAVVIIEAVTRLVPGVMGNPASAEVESFATGRLLEYPQYTRPSEFRNLRVPEVLRSGDHAKVSRWRHAVSLRRTLQRRPELLAGRELSAEEQHLLAEFPE